MVATAATPSMAGNATLAAGTEYCNFAGEIWTRLRANETGKILKAALALAATPEAAAPSASIPECTQVAPPSTTLLQTQRPVQPTGSRFTDEARSASSISAYLSHGADRAFGSSDRDVDEVRDRQGRRRHGDTARSPRGCDPRRRLQRAVASQRTWRVATWGRASMWVSKLSGKRGLMQTTMASRTPKSPRLQAQRRQSTHQQRQACRPAARQ